MCRRTNEMIIEWYDYKYMVDLQEVHQARGEIRRSLVWWLVLGIIVAAVAFFYVTGLQPTTAVVDKINATYDFVIVGGGTAGSVVASRLSENPDVTVLLLEAGGLDKDVNLLSPLLSTLERKSDHDWMYYTVPQKNAFLSSKENRGRYVRGRVLGGTSSVNNMVYMRGNSAQYNKWEAEGCAGWGYKDVIPYFLKSENFQIDTLNNSPYHSKRGPLHVSDGSAGVRQMSDTFQRATEELGYKATDCNAKEYKGYCHSQTSTSNGERVSTSRAYLHPVLGRHNLHIGVFCHVSKVLISNKKAVGVEYLRNGRKEIVGANKEVILSAGPVATPHLLMLSGVGPAEHLSNFKIPVHADLPVGKFLQDQIIIPMRASINETLTITPPRATSVISKMKYRFAGSGCLSSNGAIAGQSILHSNQTEPPNVLFTLLSTYPELWPGLDLNYQPQVSKELLPVRNGQQNFSEGFTMMIQLLNPKSNGFLQLRSSNPFDHPEINPRYLQDEDDVQSLIKGLKLYYRMIKTRAFRKLQTRPPYSPFSKCTKQKFNSDGYLECVIRHLAIVGNQPVGSCKMGPLEANDTVVDPKLRVKGIQKLRVVDGSVMPSVVSGDTFAPTLMIAEKAADLIKNSFTIKKVVNVNKKKKIRSSSKL